MHKFEENNLPVLFAPSHQLPRSRVSVGGAHFVHYQPVPFEYSFLFTDLGARMPPFQVVDIIKGTFYFTSLIIFRAPLFHYFAFRISRLNRWP